MVVKEGGKERKKRRKKQKKNENLKSAAPPPAAKKTKKNKKETKRITRLQLQEKQGIAKAAGGKGTHPAQRSRSRNKKEISA